MEEQFDQGQVFEDLYRRHYREVWALSYARCNRNSEIANDVTQEAFLRLWRQGEIGDEIINPRAWLLRVAKNLVDDHSKSAFYRNGTQPPQTMSSLRSRDPMLLELLERDETLEMIRNAMATLRDSDRELIGLAAKGYTYQELSEHFGGTWQAIKARLARAMAKLRCRLEHPRPERRHKRRGKISS